MRDYKFEQYKFPAIEPTEVYIIEDRADECMTILMRLDNEIREQWHQDRFMKRKATMN